MLVSDIQMKRKDPTMEMVSIVNGNSSVTNEVREGVYEIGHFGSSDFLHGYEHYPEVSVGPYGVCDNLQQLIDACPELTSSERKFIVTLTAVLKDKQPKDGGWRWHKWGEYIGTQNPKHDYLYDEEGIEKVYCFHIYEKID